MATPSESATLIVREAGPEDAARVAALSGQLGYPATPEEVARRLMQIAGDPGHVVLVAELAPSTRSGEVVGWIDVHEVRSVVHDKVTEIGGLVVADGQRSRGVGRLLMQQAEQWARSRGCQAVVLRSNVIRTWAHAFYEKLGYQVIKSQKVFRKNLTER